MNYYCWSRQPTLRADHDWTAVSESIFLLFPFGAGAIRGVYVTVLVITSRMLTCLPPDLDSFRPCVRGVVAALMGAVAGPLVEGVSGAAGRFEPGTSASRRDCKAASQSNTDFLDAALGGDIGE